MTEHTETIEIPSRWTTGIHVAGAVLGFAAAFVVGPLAHWLLGLAGTAPGPLRLAASLPTMWAIPILTVAGLIAGHVIASEWQKENGATTVAPEGMTVTRGDESSYVPRDQIDGVFTDGHDLVVVDGHTRELLRVKTDDVLISRLHAALERHGYPWRGISDPHEDAFTTWVDGGEQLTPAAHELLRARQRALSDKRPGAAQDARDELQKIGVVVRDRKNTQQYRVVPSGELR